MRKIKVNEIIKQRRLTLGLTLKDVSKALNVAESTVSRYESSDIQNMGIDKIEALASALKCSPGYLMGWIKEGDTSYKNASTKENMLLNNFNMLNDIGKKKLLEYSEDLACNHKYVLGDSNMVAENTDSAYHPIAAHNDSTDTNQLKKIQRDIEKIKEKSKRK